MLRNQTRIHLPNTHQNQSTDSRLWRIYWQQAVADLLTAGCGGSTDSRLWRIYWLQAVADLLTTGCGGSTDTRLWWIYWHQAVADLLTPVCGGSTDTTLWWSTDSTLRFIARHPTWDQARKIGWRDSNSTVAFREGFLKSVLGWGLQGVWLAHGHSSDWLMMR